MPCERAEPVAGFWPVESIPMITTGRWNFSERRLATTPMTPRCQPAPFNTKAASFSMSNCSLACLLAAITMLRSSDSRSALSRSMYSASASARLGSWVVSNSTPNWACPSRPAAFNRGARVKAMSSAERVLFLSSLVCFRRALRPSGACSCMSLSACRTMMRFSSKSGTTSATVPIAASVVACNKKSR